MVTLVDIQEKKVHAKDKNVYAARVVSETAELISEISVKSAGGIPVVSGNSTLFALVGGDMELYQPILKAVGAYHRQEKIALPMPIGEPTREGEFV